MLTLGRLGVAGLLAVVSACGGVGAPDAASPVGRVAIAVAPLSLSGVVEADYTLTVTNGPGGGGEVVWTKALTSTAYGDGAGSLSYVGPCDAMTGVNTVTLALTALYDANGALPVGSYMNPTPVALEATCRHNEDVAVSFELTLARDAQQGFFDVAVEFEDIFCSAKLDCVNAETGDDLALLHNPATGARDLTAVLGFACTGSLTGATWLYLDDPVITCAGFAPDVAVVDVAGQGNVDLGALPSTNPGGYLFGASVFRGQEGLAHKAYWNVSFGLNRAAFGAARECTLTARATAADVPFPMLPGGFPLPAGSVYPVIAWDVPLTTATGRVCTRHAVNAADGRVATQYVGYLPALNQFTWSPTPIALRHRFDPTTGTVLTACAAECPIEACLPDGGCAAPTCEDGRTNGDETGVDCGGATCPGCPAGAPCLASLDCTSSVCASLVCAAPSCVDAVHNGTETDLDCGGAGCAPCADGGACAAASDCASGVCADLVCAVPSCVDAVANGAETDLDCGGGCPPCVAGSACDGAGDCASGVCAGQLCAAPSCIDGVHNGVETDLDCGGPCPGCADAAACVVAGDCASGVCASLVCAAPTCLDGVHNGDELAVDCGGASCGGCAVGQPCDTVTDCANGYCGVGPGGTCADSQCFNGAALASGEVLTCVREGGNVYQVRTFAIVGSKTFTAPVGVSGVSVLVVAGGGGGGGSAYALGGGGGGGAGGLRYAANQGVSGGQSYAVVVGAGGAAGNAGPGGVGSGSSAFGITTVGGGGGGSGNTGGVPSGGGSGGGAGYNGYYNQYGAAGTAGQGYAGGNVYCSNYAAGGGGAGGNGQHQVSTNCGTGGGRDVNGGLGGPGLSYALTGVTRTYAIGGDGSIGAVTDGAAGAAGSGNGGNGSYAAANGNQGGAGGSGVVVIRHLAP